MGQTIVGTQPTNKRPVLEQFGGIYCVYCPHGHEIIQELEEALGDRIVLLNYQVGPYANPLGNDPDLGSDYGEMLQTQSQLSGYPAATINRHNFPGLEQNLPGSTAVGRADWTEAVSEILQKPAPVNIAAQASLNITTHQLDIYLEYYYTAPAANPANRLHVGITQNNVLAPQHGGNVGNYYLHQHLLREFITGPEGHIISNTGTGAYGSLTYSVTLPNDYRGVWLDPVNVELVVFITENGQEVLNGISACPTLNSAVGNDVNLLAIIADSDICDYVFGAEILFRNDGNQPLTSCQIRYGIAGGESNELAWTGELLPLAEAQLNLPLVATLPGMASNDYFIEITNPNTATDPTDYNNARTHHFTLAPQVNTTELELAIRTDQYGYELYWEIIDAAGTIHASGGNLVVAATNGGAQLAAPGDPGAYPSQSYILVPISLPGAGCYQLRVYDDYADGLCCLYGNGFYRLRLPGEQPFLEGGSFGALATHYFAVDGAVTATVVPNTYQDLVIFPNPVRAGAPLQFSWPTPPPPAFSWRLHAASGQLVATGNQEKLPATQGLPAGYYLLTLLVDNHRLNFSLVVQP